MAKITCVHLNGEQAVRLIDRLLSKAKQPKLNDLQSTIVLETWVGSTYRSIAELLSYDIDYIKQIAARLWKSLSQLLRENICKSNLRSVLERYQASILPANWDNLSDDVDADLQTIDTWMIGDRITTMSISCDPDHHHQPGSLNLDLQAQTELESLIWQNLRQPVNPNIFIDEILAALTLRNPTKNAVNCLIVNCYFDRHSNPDQIC